MFEQIKLPYAFDALEPHIDAETVRIHYGKHHATYTKNLNDLANKAGIQDKPIEVILAKWKQKSVGKSDAMGIRNNAGGFYNHNMYFLHLSPNGGGEPEGELAKAITQAFGSFSDLKQKLSAAAAGQFGSGWGWLSSDSAGQLSVSASPNQDNPILETEGQLTPILSLDVWEHAYYLKYRNVRADYIEAFFNVVDWKVVAENYSRVKTLANKTQA